MSEVCVTGYDCAVYCGDMGPIGKERRKLLRFARQSGQMFLLSLLRAMAKSGMDKTMFEPGRAALFFADNLNLVSDLDKVLEVLSEIKKSGDGYCEKSFVDYIAENWSVIEVLKIVPNIPAFLACQELGATGASSTELSSCSGGLMGVIDAYDAIRLGKSDIAFVGASTVKDQSIDLPMLRQLGFYLDGDYAPIAGTATLIIESYEHARDRNATIHAIINGAGTSFSPQTYLWHEFDGESVDLLLSSFERAGNYIAGAFTRKHLPQEIEAANKRFGVLTVADSFKAQVGYTFAASGPMEIIQAIESGTGRDTLIASLGYSGQNAAILIN
jgi:3-oxoacyl-(acyl-carrier-protein) synthase